MDKNILKNIKYEKIKIKFQRIGENLFKNNINKILIDFTKNNIFIDKFIKAVKTDFFLSYSDFTEDFVFLGTKKDNSPLNIFDFKAYPNEIIVLDKYFNFLTKIKLNFGCVIKFKFYKIKREEYYRCISLFNNGQLYYFEYKDLKIYNLIKIYDEIINFELKDQFLIFTDSQRLYSINNISNKNFDSINKTNFFQNMIIDLCIAYKNEYFPAILNRVGKIFYCNENLEDFKEIKNIIGISNITIDKDNILFYFDQFNVNLGKISIFKDKNKNISIFKDYKGGISAFKVFKGKHTIKHLFQIKEENEKIYLLKEKTQNNKMYITNLILKDEFVFLATENGLILKIDIF